MTNIITNPTFTVQIHDAHDFPKPVKYITLLVWIAACKLELKGISHSSGSVLKVIRKFLDVERAVPNTYIIEYLEECLVDIKAQLGVEA